MAEEVPFLRRRRCLRTDRLRRARGEVGTPSHIVAGGDLNQLTISRLTDIPNSTARPNWPHRRTPGIPATALNRLAGMLSASGLARGESRSRRGDIAKIGCVLQ